MKCLLLLCLVLVLAGCSSREIYRGTDSGLQIQKVIITTYDDNDNKTSRTVETFFYNSRTREWFPLGRPRPLREADTEAEVQNLNYYQGSLSAPPSATVIPPHRIYLANNAGQNAIIALDANTLNEVTRIPVESFVRGLAASPDGQTVVYNSTNASTPQLVALDVFTNTPRRRLNLPSTAQVRGILYSPDGSRIFVADSQLGIHVLDAAQLTLLQTVPRPTGISSIVSAAISPDGTLLVLRTSGTAGLSVFDLTTLQWTSPVTSGRVFVTGERPCVFHPHGHEFYCSSTDGIGIFDTATMTGQSNVAIPRGEILFRFTTFEVGAYLLVTTNRAVRLINLSNRTIEATLNPPNARTTFTTAYPVSQF